MRCPNNHEAWQEIKIGDVKVDRCFECEGLWFNQDELRQAKDSQDEYVQWFDFDLWNNEKNLKATQSLRLCPMDQSPMFEVNYAGSTIAIDACRNCLGIWLDKDEFKNVMEFVKGRSAYDLIHHYTKSLLEEGKEIFTGDESLRSEFSDLWMVIKLFRFKVFANPVLTQFLVSLPFSN